MMKIDVKALALAFGIGWGGVMLVIGTGNLLWPPYAQQLLQALASVYPGYDATPSVGGVLVGMLYGLFDGAFAGILVAWLYNLFVRVESPPQ